MMRQAAAARWSLLDRRIAKTVVTCVLVLARPAGRAQSDYAHPYAFRNFAVNLDPVGYFTPGGFPNPWGLAVDAAGNLYVADQGENTIRRISPNGTVTLLAGTPGVRGTRDGPGTSALFWGPEGVAVDSAGNVLVGDTINNTIRRITPDGLVTTLAGAGPFQLAFADGAGENAAFYYPCEMAVDAAGNAYTVDWGNECVRKITPAGVVTTLAGDPTVPGSTDGVGAAARFSRGPEGIGIDESGILYVTDSANATIRKVTPEGTVTTLAGYPGKLGTADGQGSQARFVYPIGAAVDASGNVFIGESGSFTLREIDPQGNVTTVAGTPAAYGNAEGTGASALFDYPAGLAVNAAGELFVAEPSNNLIAVGRPASAGPWVPPAPGRTVYAPFAFSTYAGQAPAGSGDGPVSAAFFNNASAVAADGAGDLFVADTGNCTVRKISAAGVVSTLAGAAGVAGWADGTGGSALFYYPAAIALDGNGNVYVADMDNTIRKISAGGVVMTLAGSAGVSGTADGAGPAAQFCGPRGLAVDAAGNVFVADSGNNAIRKISPAGQVTTFAGLASPAALDINEDGGGTADGQGAGARFNYPTGIAVDSGGNVYVADQNNHSIRKISSAGLVTTLAGDSGYSNYGAADGTGASARFYYPAGIALAANGSLLVADSYNDELRQVTPGGVVTTLATHVGFSAQTGLAGAARMMGPDSVATDASGNAYLACWGGMGIRKVAPGGALSLFAGTTGLPSASDGTGPAAGFYDPAGVAIDATGNLYVADTGNHTIRKIAPGGAVSTLAGNPAASGTADGAGSSALFESPAAVAVDGAGNTYVADEQACTVRKVSADGTVTTVAGSAGVAGYADGAGSSALFHSPAGVAVGPDGELYVADEVNCVIRRIDANGNVTTFAGSAGHPGSADGSGPQASFCNPAGLAVDASGNVYVADMNNCTLRKISAGGAVTTLAGSPGQAGPGDGAGSAARFTYPRGLAVDAAGNLYVGDAGSHTIRMVTPAGAVTTLGGAPGISGWADGAGAAARLFTPAGLCVDASGNLFIADSGNRVIRQASPRAPALTQAPLSASTASGSTVVFRAQASGSPAPAFQWFFDGNAIAGANAPTLVIADAAPADAGSYVVTVTNEAGASSSGPATLSVAPAADAGRLVNLSVNTQAGMGAQTLTIGLVVGGTSANGRENLLLRAVGPGLTAFAVSGTMPDPQLVLFDSGQAKIAANATWESTGANVAAVEAAEAATYAFALPTTYASGQDDAAMVQTLEPGAYTCAVTSASGTAGTVLGEVYDDSGAGGPTPPRLINLSCRNQIGAGGSLTAGFVVGGSTAKTVLIRASGPALTAFGVSGVLPDPQLTVFDAAGAAIAFDAGWGGDPAIASAATAVSAFPYTDPNGADSAVLITLAPGDYTAQAASASGATGQALVEIYEVP